MATFTQKSPSQGKPRAIPTEVKEQTSAMTELGIELTVRYSNISYFLIHVIGISDRGVLCKMQFLIVLLYVRVQYFIHPFPMFHSRYGEYLGLLESSSSSSSLPPSAARLERALVTTRQLLQCQQHTTRSTKLSEYTFNLVSFVFFHLWL